MATAADLIQAMAQRLVARHRGLDIGPAAEAIYDTWTNLCQFTEAWQEIVSINTVQGTTNYTLVTAYDAGAYIYAIQRLWYPDTRVMYPEVLWQFNPPNQLVLRYGAAETVTNQFQAFCIMVPIANNPAGVNTTLFAMWQNAIWTGSNARLYAAANRPWFDAGQAAIFDHSYEMLRATIRLDTQRFGTRRILKTWTPAVFA